MKKNLTDKDNLHTIEENQQQLIDIARQIYILQNELVEIQQKCSCLQKKAQDIWIKVNGKLRG